MHYERKALDTVDIGNGWQQATIELADGDTATNPSQPDEPIHGPALVIYEWSRSTLRVIVEPIAESIAEPVVDETPLDDLLTTARMIREGQPK